MCITAVLFVTNRLVAFAGLIRTETKLLEADDPVSNAFVLRLARIFTINCSARRWL